PEETPSAAIALAKIFQDVGLPEGVLNIVFGVPAEVSARLIASPTIRKISFTGSVPVGRHLSALAGQHLKRTTMELGGHAPFIVAADADLSAAVTVGTQFRYFNAGQVCASATRFYIEQEVYNDYLDAFVEHVRALKVGDGM